MASEKCNTSCHCDNYLVVLHINMTVSGLKQKDNDARCFAFGTLWAAVLFAASFVVRSLQVHKGYACRSRLACIKNISRRAPSSFCLRPLGKAAAFSLIELMIVIALIAVSYVLFFSFASENHQRSQMQLCADNLQKIYIALQIYGNDFGKYPQNTNAQTSEQVLNKLVPRYTSDTSIFICPGGRDPEIASEAPLEQSKISYAYYMGRDTNAAPGDVLMSDRQINTLSKEIGDPVFSPNGKPPGNNHHKYGGNVLNCDGSVQSIPTNTIISLAFSNGIVLLNPKP